VRQVFGDTGYWVALTDRRDLWHERALAASRTLGLTRIVTTEPVLIELLNYFCGLGPYWRDQAQLRAEAIMGNNLVEVLPYTSATLRDGMDLYASRADKGYSLTDCISMWEMRQREIYEVLTPDIHFAQEGFILLMR
jgi:predicted nucleic acid-binding protein